MKVKMERLRAGLYRLDRPFSEPYITVERVVCDRGYGVGWYLDEDGMTVDVFATKRDARRMLDQAFNGPYRMGVNGQPDSLKQWYC